MDNTEKSYYDKKILQMRYPKCSIHCIKYVKRESMYVSSNVSPGQNAG